MRHSLSLVFVLLAAPVFAQKALGTAGFTVIQHTSGQGDGTCFLFDVVPSSAAASELERIRKIQQEASGHLAVAGVPPIPWSATVAGTFASDVSARAFAKEEQLRTDGDWVISRSLLVQTPWTEVLPRCAVAGMLRRVENTYKERLASWEESEALRRRRGGTSYPKPEHKVIFLREGLHDRDAALRELKTMTLPPDDVDKEHLEFLIRRLPDIEK